MNAEELDALADTNPVAYFLALASGVMRECNTCGQDIVPEEHNIYDGRIQVACDKCLSRDPAYYLGEGMDPTPEMRARLVAALKQGTTPDATEAICRHCKRRIVRDEEGRWVDPEATGDDSVWRETCDENHEDRIAAHEPEEN